MSEDKPCSDPWLNAQLYRTVRISRIPGSETMAAVNGRTKWMDVPAAAATGQS